MHITRTRTLYDKSPIIEYTIILYIYTNILLFKLHNEEECVASNINGKDGA